MMKQTINASSSFNSHQTMKRRRGDKDEATLLNQSGISVFQSGRSDEAEIYFKRALICVEGSSKDDYMLTKKMARTEHQQFYHVSEQNGKFTMIKPSSPPTSSMLYIYQRQDYDEGMFIYIQPDPFSLQDGVHLQAATLHYNVAQTFVKRNKYAEARNWLELGLSKLLLHESQTATATAVRIYHNLGYCFYRLGLNAESMVSYQKALELAETAKLPSLYAAAAMNSTAVLLFHSNSDGCTSKAISLFQSSLAVYEETYGKDSQQVATVLNNLGRLLYRNAAYDEALEVYQKALKIRRCGGETIDIAATICNMGQTYHQRKDFDEAVSCYEEFLSLAETSLGENHRDIAVIFKCIAEINHERGDLAKAEPLYLKALSASKAALGHCHPEIASILNKLGNLHVLLNNLDDALTYYNEGLNIEQIVLHSHHPHVMVTMMNIAQIHRKRGNFAVALLKYGQIHSLQLKAYGPNSLEVASTLSSMGQMQCQQKHYLLAFELYQEALQIQRDHYGEDDNLDIACTLSSIGLVLFNQGIHELAKSCFSDSLRIRQKLLGPDHRDIAILYYNLATIYLESGDDDRAIQLYKETLRIERKAWGGKHNDAILTLQHLGLVFQRRGELNKALKHFEKALQYERSREEKDSFSIGKLLNLIGNIHLQTGNVGLMMKCYTEASRIYEHGHHSEIVSIAGFNFYLLSKLHPPCAPSA